MKVSTCGYAASCEVDDGDRLSCAVDRGLLRFDPRRFAAAAERARGALWQRAAARHLETRLAGLLPEERRGLVPVAAPYAAWSLRHDYQRDAVAFIYPLFLLAAWLWDDLVDTNKAAPGQRELIAWGYDEVVHAVTGSRATAAAPRPLELSASPFAATLDECARLMALARRIWIGGAGSYRRPIEHEVTTFFRSFLAKMRLTHHHGSYEEFFAARSRCVGMLPCFEMSYAVKARAAGLSASALHAFTSHAATRQCAHLATLHCAVVNDLFSLYKDRVLENTANFPSMLAPSADLNGYFEGARKALHYAKELFARYEAAARALPEQPGKSIAVQTWEHMMEGNLVFHLLVPRYREGVSLVRALLDSSRSEDAQRSEFVRALGVPPAEAMRVPI